MSQTLEERMQVLEKKVSELAEQQGSGKKGSWQQTFGLSRDDQGFQEMVQLGQEYRRNLRGAGQRCWFLTQITSVILTKGPQREGA